MSDLVVTVPKPLFETRHAALSVDIDRFSDAKIRHDYTPLFEHNDLPASVNQIRKACAEARAKGLKVFPPCDHTGPDGHCLGHESTEVTP